MGTNWIEKAGQGLLVVLVAGAVCSCGMLNKWFGGSGSGTASAEEQVADPAANQLVGEIASVFPKEGFVLIRRYGGGKLPEDSVFNTSGPGGRTASIQPTGERSGRYYAADVTEGLPQIGDVVVARRLPSGSVEESIPVSEPRQPGFDIP